MGTTELASGATVSHPEFRLHLCRSGWGIENHGVEPQICVPSVPSLASAEDAALATACAHASRMAAEVARELEGSARDLAQPAPLRRTRAHWSVRTGA
eukprot:538538-Pleurochrysis_carterae.AAC.2